MATKIPNLSDIGIGLGPAAKPKEESRETPLHEATETKVKSGGAEIGALTLKVDQAKAGYRDSIVPCGSCIYWQAPTGCRIVEGSIAADGTCSLAEESEEDEDYGMEMGDENMGGSEGMGEGGLGAKG